MKNPHQTPFFGKFTAHINLVKIPKRPTVRKPIYFF